MPGSTPAKQRFYREMAILGFASGAVQAALAVFVGVRHGVGAVGLTSAGSVAGQLLALAAERHGVLPSVRTRALISAAGCSLGLSILAFAPWWMAPFATCIMGLLAQLLSTALMQQHTAIIPTGTAVRMAGTMTSLSLCGVAAAVDNLGALIAGYVGLVMTGMVRGSGEVSRGEAAPAGASRAWVFMFLLATTSYGPVVLFPTLVSTELSAAWIGPAAAVYTAGSFIAGRVLGTKKVSQPVAALIAASASGLAGIGLSSVPAMLLVRLLSGVALFIAQGAALTRASERGGRAGLGAALVAMNLGAQLSGIWAAQAAEVSTALMAGLSAFAGLCLALGCLRQTEGRGEHLLALSATAEQR